MTNDGPLPITVHGLADQAQPRLFTCTGLAGPDRLDAGGTVSCMPT